MLFRSVVLVIERRSLVEESTAFESVCSCSVDAAPVFFLVGVAERQIVLVFVAFVGYPLENFVGRSSRRQFLTRNKDHWFAVLIIAEDRYIAEPAYHIEGKKSADNAGFGKRSVIETVVIALTLCVADHTRTSVLDKLVAGANAGSARSEEHTSELQSPR